MKTRILVNSIIFLLLLSVKQSSAQNLVPLDWKISFSDPSSLATRDMAAEDNISLLLSWERQNYFGGDGKCTLSTEFNVNQPNLQYKISSKVQCHILSMRINGKEVATNVNTDFWGDRKKTTEVLLPKKLLKKGKNSVELLCENLGYTGGISHNIFTITPVNNKCKEEVKISVNSKNHLFINENPILSIQTKGCTKGELSIKIENDFHKLLLDTVIAVNSAKNSILLNLSKTASKPGFYQCSAVLHGKGYCGDVQWVAINPEKIECNNVESRFFDSYWNKAKSELAKVSPNFKMHKVDSLSYGTRNCYIVEMQSLGNLTIRGYYFVPKNSSKHRALLHVPGYGYGFNDVERFSKMSTDRIDFALCVRGHGISADKFNPGFGLPGIWGYQLCNSDSIAYRAIYMDCVRAVDFLSSRPEVDKKHIGVEGGSQGGGLSLVTAGLCNDRISACAYFDPFPCDIRHSIETRIICRTELYNFIKYYNNCCSFFDAMNIQDLIDTRYFAPRIKCKVNFATSLFDDDCPPHQGFAAYNLINSPKQYTIYPNDSHLGESNYGKMFLDWFDEVSKQ